MSHNTLSRQQGSRFYPYLLPTHSSWVSASAGSGKTKILTDRVLSLLLHGIPPEQILCLTFTKAAAAEMRTRVLKAMSSWQHMSPELLRETLADLLGDRPDLQHLERAQHLFPEMLEKLQSLKIQTIHSFAQHLLAQFPLESGIDPNFTILDPLEGERLFTSCVKQELAWVKKNQPSWAQEISLYHDLNSLEEKLKALLGQQLPKVVSLYEMFDLPQGLSKEDHEKAFWQKRPLQMPEAQDTDTYIKVFLTAEGQIRKKLLPAAEAKKNPQKLIQMEEEAERVLRFKKEREALDYIAFTEVFSHIVEHIETRFIMAKKRRRVLDYDDLITKTKSLLRQPDVAPWILYKIDAAICHILVDEAQDTNASQWDIIEALYDDFFKGHQDQARSVFIVGDQKQSIYGFQGAEPLYFKTAGEKIRQVTFEGQVGFEHVSLDKSYRSSPAVLKAVDAVFNLPRLKKSIGFEGDALKHHVHRSEAPGVVELWPLIEGEKQGTTEGWRLPQDNNIQVKAIDQLVSTLIHKIKERLMTAHLYEPLREVEPKDILILLRKRGKLMSKIVNALKAEKIPVAGADRLVLREEVVVLDLLNLADFALCPEDDVALAGVLKSPLMGWSEDQLFEVCQKRESSLWATLEDHEKLSRYSQLSTQLSPYHFYTDVLFHNGGFEKFISRLGPECEDVIDAFLNLTLTFESSHTPSLQDFVIWMRSLSEELKRDTEEGRNQVRIMTIHGSKGLQAPLVFIVEIASTPQQRLPLMLETEGGLALPARPTIDHDMMLSLKEQRKEEERAEYDRLLYVGMTRAQDQLYMMGIAPQRKSHAGSWYEDVKAALQPIAHPVEHERGTILRIADPVLVEMKTEPLQKIEEQEVELPAWVTSSVFPGMGRTRPTCPEKPKANHGPLKFSPYGDLDPGFKLHQLASASGSARSGEHNNISKGIFLHKLCEILHRLPASRRQEVAHAYLKASPLNEDADLPRLIQNLLEMMVEPETQWIFDEGYSELPLKGEIDGIPYDVRIDRLVIRGDTLSIIDYKLSLPEDLETYQAQLGVYKMLVQKMYPGKSVATYLLGIEEKRLVEVTVSHDVMRYRA